MLEGSLYVIRVFPMHAWHMGLTTQVCRENLPPSLYRMMYSVWAPMQTQFKGIARAVQHLLLLHTHP